MVLVVTSARFGKTIFRFSGHINPNIVEDFFFLTFFLRCKTYDMMFVIGSRFEFFSKSVLGEVYYK